jgi:hypothetical protein
MHYLCLIETGLAIQVLSLPFEMEFLLFTGLMARLLSLRQRQHMVAHDPFIKSRLASRNTLHGLVWGPLLVGAFFIV